MSSSKAAIQAAGGEQGRQPAKTWQDTMRSVSKTVLMFVGMQLAMRYGMQTLGFSKPSPPAADSAKVASQPGQTVQAMINAVPIWPLGTPLSMLLFTSTTELPQAQLQTPLPEWNDPVVVWDGLTYGNWNDVRDVDLLLDVPESVRSHNGSWWMDVLLVRGGGTDFTGKGPGDVAMFRKQLTRFLPKKRVRREKKLIGGEDGSEEMEEEPTEVPPQTIVSHWSNNLTLTIVSSGGPMNLATMPPTLSAHYILGPSPPESSDKHYYPPMFPNDFWLLKENMLPINVTSKTLPLHINYHALSQLKLQIFATMTQSFEQAAQQQGTGAEMDEVKRMLTETSPWLLITTAIVTLLHTLFEFLAFSSDIGHWRKKDKDLVGVSLNTILTNCFVQVVILLYLQDSSEETSFMILLGQGVGLLIEAWKITRVVDIRVRDAPGSLLGKTITFEDKKVLSEDEKKTQEYDNLAFKIVSYFAIPALAGYTIYSLLYETHRGWYSFVVTTLAQAIYMFGFVQLVPQLIINYKLKSVAHMPMKAMMYKTLSTVVDDFFAFCIRMPWLHRLACFRDDVVFVVLLYQRWIYRVDYSRVNEYGQVNEEMTEPVGESKKDK